MTSRRHLTFIFAALAVAFGGCGFDFERAGVHGGASSAHSPDGKTIIVNGGGGPTPPQPPPPTQPTQPNQPGQPVPPSQDPTQPPGGNGDSGDDLPQIKPGDQQGGGGQGGQGGTAPPSTPPAPPPGSCGTAWETEVLRLTNQERANNGLQPFSCDNGATKAAHDYSQTMCDTGHFSHTGPDGSSPGDRLKRAGVTGIRGWGENIAWGQRDPAAVVRTWMNSPGHRRNILGNFTHMGPGHVTCGNGRNYWTQVFIKR